MKKENENSIVTMPFSQLGDPTHPVVDLTVYQNFGYRVLRILPLLTIIMQLLRSMALFQQPLQAQPFNSRIVSFKYFSKVILTVFSIFRLVYMETSNL